jgi:hypothetical protein
MKKEQNITKINGVARCAHREKNAIRALLGKNNLICVLLFYLYKGMKTCE